MHPIAAESPTPSVPTRVKLGNTRTTGKEQFYTPRALAEALVAIAAKVIPNFTTRHILEPAGGTGNFIEASLGAGVASVTSYDIEPLHALVQEQDFLGLSDLPLLDYVTISNPPFGRNNALSVPFFNKAAQHSTYICFLVPRSWRKWSVMNRLDSRFHLVYDQDVSANYVSAENRPISDNSTLKTCFQIWERRETNRAKIDVQDLGLVEKTSYENADVSLTIFGYGCGTVKEEFPRRPNTTQMFLKLKDPRSLDALKSVDFSRFYLNTAYTEALSLKEINFLINEAIFGDPMLVGNTETSNK